MSEQPLRLDCPRCGRTFDTAVWPAGLLEVHCRCGLVFHASRDPLPEAAKEEAARDDAQAADSPD